MFGSIRLNWHTIGSSNENFVKKVMKFQASQEAEMSNGAKKLPVFQEKFFACCYIIWIVLVKLENLSDPSPPSLLHFQFRPVFVE